MKVVAGILIPFIGTTLGAAFVFLFKNKLNRKVEKLLLGLASGIMIAASIWSLIIPSIEMSSHLDKLAWLPACIGFLVGVAFLLLLDILIPHIHFITNHQEGIKNKLSKEMKMFLAVTLHNIPEGMAVGIILAGFLANSALISLSGAIVFSVGIAIQNIPEGAIVSLNFQSDGNTRGKSFIFGFLSGVVEPLAAILTIFLTSIVEAILPYLLAFAAGAMIYVVVDDLIPSSQEGEHSDLATIGVAIGFVLMMVLDIAFA